MIRLFLLIFLSFILVACGGGGGEDQENSPSPAQNNQTVNSDTSQNQSTDTTDTSSTDDTSTTEVEYSLSGSAVKGPLSAAQVNLYRFDASADEYMGEKIASGKTNQQAKITGLVVPSPLEDAYILEVLATESTIDLSTGQAPYFSRLLSIVSAQDIENGIPMSVTPMTTLATVSTLAQHLTSAEELVSEVESSATKVTQTLGFGLDENLDIFRTQAAIYDDDTEAVKSALAYRTAIESVAAITQYITLGSDSAPDTLLSNLGKDLTDGQLDGRSSETIIPDYQIENIQQRIQLAPIAHLPIPNQIDPNTGAPVTVNNLEQNMVEELAITAPQTDANLVLIPENQSTPIPTSPDFDNDGWPDVSDDDDDNDSVTDDNDAFPFDSTESEDTDADGIGNNADEDDDNDGTPDIEDAFPLDDKEQRDSDGDGIGNNADSDDDNDNIPDTSDDFPLDASESLDTDNDGIGNNADNDDDNDGVEDAQDAFPFDATESLDSDADGVGNNSDSDDDNDGVADESDVFPLDTSEFSDADADGIGNNADNDDDNDGVEDTQDAFPFDATESLDSDSDGIGNNADSDDDNDGTPDTQDEMPLDATESKDTDGDGIGNNADTDDDNDGYQDQQDAFPLERACWLSSHAKPDNSCDFSATKPLYLPDSIISDEASIIYLVSKENKRIDRWSSLSQDYLAPIYLDDNKTIDADNPVYVVYSESHQRLYISYYDGEIKYVDAGQSQQQPYIRHWLGADVLLAVGDSLLVRSYRVRGRSYTAYNKSGLQTAIGESLYITNNDAWDPSKSRLYTGNADYSFIYYDVDPLRGDDLDHVYPNRYFSAIEKPFKVSPDGEYIIDGNSRLYETTNFNYIGALIAPVGFEQAVWTPDNGLITVETREIVVRDNKRRIIDKLSKSGDVLAITKTLDGYVFISATGLNLSFQRYQWQEDMDGDGVNNSEDGFPKDAAASLDTDKDGYPDAWNSGMAQDDSITGLRLDALVNNRFCWLTSQLDSQGLCDYSHYYQSIRDISRFSERLNAHWFIDKYNVIYLYHSYRGFISRYSLSEQKQLRPIDINKALVYTNEPGEFSYNAQNHKLYLSYYNGLITQVDLSEDVLTETLFVQSGYLVRALQATDNFVFVSQGSSVITSSSYNLNGEKIMDQTTLFDINNTDQYGNSIAFYYTYGNGHIGSINIDQDNGRFDMTTSDISEQITFGEEIKYINQGRQIMLSSGKVYDAYNYSLLHDFGTEIKRYASLGELLVFKSAPRTLEVYTTDGFTHIKTINTSVDIEDVLASETSIVLVLKSTWQDYQYQIFTESELTQ